jgi:hypothetical protein
MGMDLFAVRVRDTDKVYTVAARTKLAARMRVSETSGVALRRLEAAPEIDVGGTRRRHFRCGQVSLCVMWSDRESMYHVGSTFEGERRYSTVGRPAAAAGAVDSVESMRDAARATISFLLGTDDLDESLVVWSGEPGQERPHVVEGA